MSAFQSLETIKKTSQEFGLTGRDRSKSTRGWYVGQQMDGWASIIVIERKDKDPLFRSIGPIERQTISM